MSTGTPVRTLTPDEVFARIMRKKPAKVPSVVPGGGKIIDSVMEGYIAAGLNGRQIVEAYQHEHGIKITRAAVSLWRKNRGIGVRPENPHMEELVPWRIASEHQAHRLLRALRTEARLRAGLPVSRPDAQRHAAVMADIEETGGVIAYDRINGFNLVKPRPGIDNDFIRDPRFKGDGSPVPNKEDWQ